MDGLITIEIVLPHSWVCQFFKLLHHVSSSLCPSRNISLKWCWRPSWVLDFSFLNPCPQLKKMLNSSAKKCLRLLENFAFMSSKDGCWEEAHVMNLHLRTHRHVKFWRIHFRAIPTQLPHNKAKWARLRRKFATSITRRTINVLFPLRVSPI